MVANTVHETITFLDVTSIKYKLIDVYNCTHFAQTHVFDAILAFLCLL